MLVCSSSVKKRRLLTSFTDGAIKEAEEGIVKSNKAINGTQTLERHWYKRLTLLITLFAL